MLRGPRELPGRGHRRRRLIVRRLALLVVATLVAPLLVSCGKAEDSGAAFDSSDFYTSDGLFHVLTYTDPSPPTAGAAALHMTITHASDESPVPTTARVTAEAWEVTEGAAVSPGPLVGIMGEGEFVASWVYPRPGLYQVELSISDETGADGAVLTYTVQ